MGKKVHRKAKTLLIVFAGMLFMATSIVAYYLIISEAPIIRGEVDYQVNFKDQLSLDIYYPTTKVYDLSPVLIYFHGGAWIAGTKGAINFNRFNDAINELRESGYTIICPNYTLARNGQSPFPQCIVDAFDAINWVEDHAEQYNLDLNNVGLLGESAGSHIAMMSAFAAPEAFDLSFNKPDFRYILNIYGPNDMAALYRAPLLDTLSQVIESLPAGLQGPLDLPRKIFGFDPIQDTAKTSKFIHQFSPTTYLKESVPPMLLIHGSSDRVVPVEQSITLNEQLTKLGIPHELHILEGVDHAFRGATTEQMEDIQRWTVDFVKRNYSAN